jgi:hypothetical protein
MITQVRHMLYKIAYEMYRYMVTQNRHVIEITHETYKYMVTQDRHNLKFPMKRINTRSHKMGTRRTKLPIWYNTTLYVTTHLYTSKN